MSRLLALWLLALAAPAAAEQVHPCQAQTPPCSLAMALTLHGLDEANRELDEANRELDEARRDLAQASRDEEEALRASRRQAEWIREAGPGVWETPAERAARRDRMRQPRHHVPYPLSRELLSGAVNPCAYASCPPELDRIYDWLSEARRRDDQSRLEMYQRKLRYYYYEHRP